MECADCVYLEHLHEELTDKYNQILLSIISPSDLKTRHEEVVYILDNFTKQKFGGVLGELERRSAHADWLLRVACEHCPPDIQDAIQKHLGTEDKQ